eukprot:749318-Hanusia_phi.AAC.2
MGEMVRRRASWTMRRRGSEGQGEQRVGGKGEGEEEDGEEDSSSHLSKGRSRGGGARGSREGVGNEERRGGRDWGGKQERESGPLKPRPTGFSLEEVLVKLVKLVNGWSGKSRG